MFLLRYLHLSFLLILAPIVWLFWVVPVFQKYFNDWWDSFIKWILFAPGSAFFIYLSLVSIRQLGNALKGADATAFFPDGAIAGIMQQGTRLLVLSGFMFGSLIVGQKLGVAGASGSIGLAKKAGGKARGWAGKQVKQRAAGARERFRNLRTETDEKGVSTNMWQRGIRRLNTPESDAGKTARTVANVASFGMLGKAMRGTQDSLAKQHAGQSKLVEEEQKKVNNLSDDDAISRAQQTVGSSNATKAAYGLRLIKDGNLDKTDEKTQKRLLKAVQKTRKVKDALGLNPLLVTKLTDTSRIAEKQGISQKRADNFAEAQAASKVTADQADNLSKEALNNDVIAANLTEGVAGRIGSLGLDKVEKLDATLTRLIDNPEGLRRVATNMFAGRTPKDEREKMSFGAQREAITELRNSLLESVKRNRNALRHSPQAQREGGPTGPTDEVPPTPDKDADEVPPTPDNDTDEVPPTPDNDTGVAT